MAFYILILTLTIISLTITSIVCSPESEILLKFKTSLSNHESLSNWNDNTTPCSGETGNWNGVHCSNGRVYGLKLENMGMKGFIDTSTLSNLPNLRTLSFMNNDFDGIFPDIKKLGALKSIYLSNNHFSGEISDDAFDQMLSLKKVHLAHNGFIGKMPNSLTKLPKLLELRLEGNQFQGEIPHFEFAHGLKSFNVSNNLLAGPIPVGLVKMDPASFMGNKELCGQPLEQQCKIASIAKVSSSSDSSSRSSSNENMSPLTVITALIVVGLAVSGIIGGFFILIHRSKDDQSIDAMLPSDLKQIQQGQHDQSTNSTKKVTVAVGEQGKLSFLRDDREMFDLPDLLKASAEILGSGVFGSSYKASLLSGVMMVVKRFKQMNNVGKEEFQEHMRRLGRLRHPNLLPLVAYYYRKEEKLLISDYVENGSLALHLHGNKSRGMSSPDWLTRLKIVKGVAKGLTYLYKELPSIVTPHGHLKSSNVLLNESFEPLLTDYGQVPVTNLEHAQELMVAYKSPEYAQNGRITKKTDVWCFGILILEILTGRFPAHFLQKVVKSDDEPDLASWVKSFDREEWVVGGEVFDKEMKVTKKSKGEMAKLMDIGLACCECDTEKRMDLKEVVIKIDELKDFDAGL